MTKEAKKKAGKKNTIKIFLYSSKSKHNQF